MDSRTWRIYKVRKLQPELRDVFRAHVENVEEDYKEIHGGEDGYMVSPGDTAFYAARLDDTGHRAFMSASNFIRAEDEVIAHTTNVEFGVDLGALNYHELGAFDKIGATGGGVLVGVGDTGTRNEGYLSGRFAADGIWDWTGGTGYAVNTHGWWTCGAALPGGAQLISGKVLNDSGAGSSADIEAFVFRFIRRCIADRKRGVVSLSLGSDTPSWPTMEDAAKFGRDNGVLVLAAAGNDGFRDRINAPANCPSVISVGAIDHRTEIAADFSNRSGTEPNVYTAGVNLEGLPGPGWSGTSMATPIAARIAVCLLSSGDIDVKKTMLDAAASYYGILRSRAAIGRIQKAAPAPTPTPTPAPAPAPEPPAQMEKMGRYKFCVTPIVKLTRPLKLTFWGKTFGTFTPGKE